MISAGTAQTSELNLLHALVLASRLLSRTQIQLMSRNEGGWDHEDEIHHELLLEKHNAEPEQEQVFCEAITPG